MKTARLIERKVAPNIINGNQIINISSASLILGEIYKIGAKTILRIAVAYSER